MLGATLGLHCAQEPNQKTARGRRKPPQISFASSELLKVSEASTGKRIANCIQGNCERSDIPAADLMQWPHLQWPSTPATTTPSTATPATATSATATSAMATSAMARSSERAQYGTTDWEPPPHA